ncbi:MAG: glutathione S-transferase family protein [Alphaproteobacteria bacterium]
MLELYTWTTTNSRRGIIMCEESGLPYKINWINIQKGDQKAPGYEAINPYRKVPALVDGDGPGGKPANVFESVAICFYLAEKTKKFLGTPETHPDVLKWSMFHATNVLSVVGNLGRIDDPSILAGSKTLFEVMDKHLAGREFFAGAYSIADIIPYTRIAGVKHDELKVADYPNVAAWLARVGARPAVKTAMELKPA